MTYETRCFVQTRGVITNKKSLIALHERSTIVVVLLAVAFGKRLLILTNLFNEGVIYEIPRNDVVFHEFLKGCQDMRS